MSNTTYILDDELLASGGKRFVNYLIDYAFTYILGYAFGLFWVVVADVLDSFEITGFRFWMYNLGQIEWFVVGVLLTLLYYILIEGVFGVSLGKLVTGTVVVNENGKKPDFKTIIKRNLCRCIPFEAFSFLGSRGWHDSISDTYVVEKKELSDSIKLFHELKLIGAEDVE